jgi:hypothetical protein
MAEEICIVIVTEPDEGMTVDVQTPARSDGHIGGYQEWSDEIPASFVAYPGFGPQAGDVSPHPA